MKGLRKVNQCFLFYSFIGWILEGLFNVFAVGHFKKPNFLHGPVKPMYGIGAVALLGSYKLSPSHFRYHCWLIPCLVEFCSGLWLERRFSLKYWDYSKEFGQIGGYICLKFALCWIILAYTLVKLVQPMADRLLCRCSHWKIWRLWEHLFLLDMLITFYQRTFGSKRVISGGGL